MSEYIPPIESTEIFPQEVHVIAPPPQQYWLHALLLFLTFCTTMVVGARLQNAFLTNQTAFALDGSGLPLFPLSWLWQQPTRIWMGLPFSLTLMGILLAHEMGHYLYCKKYHVRATLPYFIPAPTLIGTLGAFIRIQSPIRSRDVLFDIGIAGPIAGFVVAVPVAAVGLMLSHAGAAPEESVFGFPLIMSLLHWLIPFGDSHGVALHALFLHPVAIAGWVGMFATSLNLLPGGQLDGGHIVYSLAPHWHKTVSRIAIATLVPLGIFYWVGWLIWAVLLWFSGLRHPNVPAWPELSRSRRRIAWVALILLALTIVPAPFSHGSLYSIIQSLRHPELQE